MSNTSEETARAFRRAVTRKFGGQECVAPMLDILASEQNIVLLLAAAMLFDNDFDLLIEDLQGRATGGVHVVTLPGDPSGNLQDAEGLRDKMRHEGIESDLLRLAKEIF